MFLVDKHFLKPTKKSRILAILENLSIDSSISQSDMGHNTCLSGAMVNTYLKELKSKGSIELKPINGKSFKYDLTPAGEDQRCQYLGQYCAEIVQIYSALKKMIYEKLESLQSQGCVKLILFGASETCEVTISALKNLDCRILAIVDNDVNKQGEVFHGHVIYPPLILENISYHAVVITSFGRQAEIYDQLKMLSQKKKDQFQIIRL